MERSMIDDSVQPQERDKNVPEIKQEKKNSSKKVVFFALLTIVLLGSILSVFTYIASKNSDSNTTGSTKKDIAKLRIGMLNEEIDPNYPAAESGATIGQIEIASQLFEGLVQYKDLTKIQPLLAKSWSNPNGDTSTWNFELKKNVRFHTGRTLTADDVKFSIEALQKTDNSTAQQFASTIEKVTVISPYKVEIKTTGPDPILLNKLAYVYIVDSKSKTPNNPVNGTGPFIIKPRSKPTISSLELVPFENYHGGHSYVRALSFKNYPEEAALVSDLKKKKLELGGDVSNTNLGSFPSNKYTKLVDDGAVTLYMTARVAKGGPIAKKEVREALNLLIDKEKYFKNAGFTGTVAEQLIPSQLTGHDPNIVPHKLDTAKAKTLLAQAGYSSGVKLKVYHFDNLPETALEGLASDAAKGGITLDFQLFPNQDDPSESIQANEPDLFIYGWASAVVDGIDFLSEGVVTASGTTDKQLLDDIDAAQVEFDPAKRLKLLQDGSRRVFDETLVIPFYHRTYYQISTNPSYVFKQEISGTSRGIYYWQSYQK